MSSERLTRREALKLMLGAGVGAAVSACRRYDEKFYPRPTSPQEKIKPDEKVPLIPGALAITTRKTGFHQIVYAETEYGTACLTERDDLGDPHRLSLPKGTTVITIDPETEICGVTRVWTLAATKKDRDGNIKKIKPLDMTRILEFNPYTNQPERDEKGNVIFQDEKKITEYLREEGASSFKVIVGWVSPRDLAGVVTEIRPAPPTATPTP